MSTNLNLARKWRSKSFDQIVGQALPVRMLKNSLYLESYFPVYLFSGQRGCGKTTMARVFACAINCDQLPMFQKNPKATTVPCLECASCLAMQTGRHPDFIEIDAASYTGVDNVRHIIDVASLLPVLGRKKIYLIDEAHMLSKAAFNAFLKILEEPPASVVFILATTDAQKIIDTVKSRCFQLFFTPIDELNLANHLATICDAENIAYEPSGLQLIVKATQGSARDAINLLEQVRFSTSSVTKSAVRNMLGHFDDEQTISLFKLLLSKDTNSLLKFISTHKVTHYAPEFIWQKLVELTRAALWIKHGVEPNIFIDHIDTLKKIVTQSSIGQLHELLDIFYSNESVFLKTTAQHGLLETILLKICQKNGSDNSGSSCPPGNATPHQQTENELCADQIDEDQEVTQEYEQQDEQLDDTALWRNFLRDVQTLNDPLLNSVFSQGTSIQFDAVSKKVDVAFSKDLVLFQEWIDNAAPLWKPLLYKSFGEHIVFNAHFTVEQKKKIVEPRQPELTAQASAIKTTITSPTSPVPQQKAGHNAERSFNKPFAPYTPKKFATHKESMHPRIDVSDVTIWKKANMLLGHFPGTIREIRESTHE